ncbi:MAG: hypothetical protein KA168_01035 [Chitinophagales bacterium]|jgi:hypothetical protein|nr:hypothetical protein [Chitinophagales bacterium]
MQQKSLFYVCIKVFLFDNANSGQPKAFIFHVCIKVFLLDKGANTATACKNSYFGTNTPSVNIDKNTSIDICLC